MNYKTETERILDRKIGEDEDIESFFEELLLKEVKNFPFETLHQMVMEWNWDSYDSFLEWLVDNENTDKATILMIYWKSEPRHKKCNSLVEIIEKNYENNFYKNSNFSFNPKNDFGEDWTLISSKNHNRNIPEIMFEELKGLEINQPTNFIEGIPEYLDDILGELFEIYE